MAEDQGAAVGERQIVTRCGWCQNDDDVPEGVLISHGICTDCNIRILSEELNSVTKQRDDLARKLQAGPALYLSWLGTLTEDELQQEYLMRLRHSRLNSCISECWKMCMAEKSRRAQDGERMEKRMAAVGAR